jgi:hypothetical protein
VAIFVLRQRIGSGRPQTPPAEPVGTTPQAKRRLHELELVEAMN